MFVRPRLEHVTAMLGGLGDLEELLPRLGLRVLRQLESLLLEEGVAEPEGERGAVKVHVHEGPWQLALLPLPERDHALASRVQLLLRALLRAWRVARLPVDLTFARGGARRHMVTASGICVAI